MYELPKVGFLEAYILFWKNYINFKGRSRRSEYWWTVLWHVIVLMGGSIVSILFLFIPIIGPIITVIGMVTVSLIYPLATLIPNFSLLTRRFHDRGFSMLVPLISFILSILMSISSVVTQTQTIMENPESNVTVYETTGLFGFLPTWLVVIVGLISLALTIFSFIITLLNSKKETNKYGPSPKYISNKAQQPIHE